jgi:hypothetical protein
MTHRARLRPDGKCSRKGGRPSNYSAALAEAICQQGYNRHGDPQAIFHLRGNDDNSNLGPIGVHQWYPHHYALTGGEEMTLHPGGIYDEPVTYRTFFQAAVQEIG